MQRTGEKVFGFLAILAGVGLIAAVIAGVEVSSVVLAFIPLVVIGWLTYYWIVVRPAASGVQRPDSDDHE